MTSKVEKQQAFDKGVKVFQEFVTAVLPDSPQKTYALGALGVLYNMGSESISKMDEKAGKGEAFFQPPLELVKTDPADG